MINLEASRGVTLQTLLVARRSICWPWKLDDWTIGSTGLQLHAAVKMALEGGSDAGWQHLAGVSGGCSSVGAFHEPVVRYRGFHTASMEGSGSTVYVRCR